MRRRKKPQIKVVLDAQDRPYIEPEDREK